LPWASKLQKLTSTWHDKSLKEDCDHYILDLGNQLDDHVSAFAVHDENSKSKLKEFKAIK